MEQKHVKNVYKTERGRPPTGLDDQTVPLHAPSNLTLIRSDFAQSTQIAR